MRRLNLWLVKALHTVIFLGLSGSVFYLLYSAAANRVTRWTHLAFWSIVVEGAVLLLFGGNCPLRLLAEEMGEERGSVTDIFLPRWLADRIFVIFTPLFIVGALMLGLRSFQARGANRRG